MAEVTSATDPTHPTNQQPKPRSAVHVSMLIQCDGVAFLGICNKVKTYCASYSTFNQHLSSVHCRLHNKSASAAWDSDLKIELGVQVAQTY
jgi:hypothetical protein